MVFVAFQNELHAMHLRFKPKLNHGAIIHRKLRYKILYVCYVKTSHIFLVCPFDLSISGLLARMFLCLND